MRVEHLLEKGIGAVNEDAVLLAEPRFGVFDGVTSIDRYVDAEGKTGGYRASHIAFETFERSSHSLQEAALEANLHIRNAMEEEGLYSDAPEKRWGTTLAVVEIDETNGGFEWIQIADSFIVVIHKDESVRSVTARGFPDTDILLEWKTHGLKKETDIRSKMLGKIIELRKTANIRYGILNGDPNVGKFLQTGNEPLRDITHILIFTDGFLIPAKNPAAREDFSLMASLFKEGGLKRVRDHIRQIEETDPNCWTYPRYKKSDDMAAIAIALD